jgi:hypothetical protein
VSVLEILAVLGAVAYVMVRQLLGEPIRAKRLIILPGVLTLIGVVDLAKHTVHSSDCDILLIAIGAAISAVIGLAQGRALRLEARDGSLWGRLPRQGLWLWLLLYASRGALVGLAHVTGAHVAAGGQSELLVLGVNRLGQAAIVAWRGAAAGIPFAPEKDGRRSSSTLPALRGAWARPSPDQPPTEALAEPSVGRDPGPNAATSRWTNLAGQIGAAASAAEGSGPRRERAGRPGRREVRRERRRR